MCKRLEEHFQKISKRRKSARILYESKDDINK